MTAFSEPERSPGHWVAPSGARPAWNWIPEGHGLRPRLEAVPRWVRLWYRTPLIDRYAHAWMWHHGGWDVVPDLPEPGDPAGDREPRRPVPPPLARRDSAVE